MTTHQTPNLPSGWVVVTDRQSVLDQLQQLSMEKYHLGGVEIRLDLWQGNPPELDCQAGLSVLVTDRGGLDSVQRSDLRDRFCQLHGGLIDVDPDTDAPAPALQSWIFSCHRTETTEMTPQQQVVKAREMGAVAVKIVMPETSDQNLRIARELPQSQPDFPIVCFCAGEEGSGDRIRALDAGQPWGYARLGQHPEQIPGLPRLENLYS